MSAPPLRVGDRDVCPTIACGGQGCLPHHCARQTRMSAAPLRVGDRNVCPTIACGGQGCLPHHCVWGTGMSALPLRVGDRDVCPTIPCGGQGCLPSMSSRQTGFARRRCATLVCPTTAGITCLAMVGQAFLPANCCQTGMSGPPVPGVRRPAAERREIQRQVDGSDSRFPPAWCQRPAESLLAAHLTLRRSHASRLTYACPALISATRIRRCRRARRRTGRTC